MRNIHYLILAKSFPLDHGTAVLHRNINLQMHWHRIQQQANLLSRVFKALAALIPVCPL